MECIDFRQKCICKSKFKLRRVELLILGTTSQSYGMSLAIATRDQLHSVNPTYWTHTALTSALQTGRYLIYLSRRDGRLSWPRLPEYQLHTDMV